MTPTTLADIQAKSKAGKNGCLLWCGATAHNGYGVVSYLNKQWRTHRLVWFFTHGRIPRELQVCHKCDTPACVNPDHLFLGTAKINYEDSRIKGRSVRGSRSPHAKLTEAQVVEIRASKLCPRCAAGVFGVKPAQIGHIRKGKSWVHILPTAPVAP